jgi:hypothetical protein
MVVDPLRDLEEPGVAVDHHPPGIDTRAARIREQGLQELGDATAGRRRVHIHYRATLQHGACGRSRRLESLRAFGSEQ